jgi:hypothetical protein
MAATLSSNTESKYARNELEPLDDISAFDSYDRLKTTIRTRVSLSERLPEDLLPRRFQFIKGRKLYDWNDLTSFSLGIWSTRLKDIVEGVEPGVHQFAPVEIFHKDGSPYGGTFWLWQCCTMIDAISPDLGGVYKRQSPFDPDYYSWVIKSGGWDKLAVYKEKIAGRAMWRDRRYPVEIFFSDAVLAAMQAERTEGWHITRNWKEI